MDDKLKKDIEKYEHIYCLHFHIECKYKQPDDDDFEEDDCPVTYKQFIFAIERLIGYYKENGLDRFKCGTLHQIAAFFRDRDDAEHFIGVSDAFDDLKKTLEIIIERRIADGLDVESGKKILQDISKL